MILHTILCIPSFKHNACIPPSLRALVLLAILLTNSPIWANGPYAAINVMPEGGGGGGHGMRCGL